MNSRLKNKTALPMTSAQAKTMRRVLRDFGDEVILMHRSSSGTVQLRTFLPAHIARKWLTSASNQVREPEEIQ